MPVTSPKRIDDAITNLFSQADLFGKRAIDVLRQLLREMGGELGQIKSQVVKDDIDEPGWVFKVSVGERVYYVEVSTEPEEYVVFGETARMVPLPKEASKKSKVKKKRRVVAAVR